MLRLGGVLLFLVCLAPASDTPPGGKFHGCPVNGNVGDLTLNGLKNRTAQVDAPSEDITSIDDILNLDTPTVTTSIARSKWSAKDKQIVAGPEKEGVQIEGFLGFVKSEGAERCNCGDPDETDSHIWVCPAPKSPKKSCVVVEATPRWQEANDSWDQTSFSALAHEKAPVRITGWLTYDQDHGSEVGKSRASLWEIHPITKIEVKKDGSFEELQ
jgi:hypothetical protein